MIKSWSHKGLMRAVDGFYRVLPQNQPLSNKLAKTRVVSHRGEFNNRTVFENTLAAFDRLLEAGVWGMECDIHWTKDQCPVVSHDPHLKRLFGANTWLSDLSLFELQKTFPLIPSLEQVVQRYGKRLHLMLELKQDKTGLNRHRLAVLESILADLVPGDHFHLLALVPDLLSQVDFVPPQSLLPVAETNVKRLSQLAVENQWAGIAGHFVLINEQLNSLHKRAGQKIGTGFIASKACLHREINRDVDWIFSNHASKLQATLNQSNSFNSSTTIS